LARQIQSRMAPARPPRVRFVQCRRRPGPPLPCSNHLQRTVHYREVLTSTATRHRRSAPAKSWRRFHLYGFPKVFHLCQYRNTRSVAARARHTLLRTRGCPPWRNSGYRRTRGFLLPLSSRRHFHGPPATHFAQTVPTLPWRRPPAAKLFLFSLDDRRSSSRKRTASAASRIAHN
jgi:hypothetical protein